MIDNKNLPQEWLALHKSYDLFEALSLVIKLLSIVLFFISFSLEIKPLISIVSLLILWLQEGILKTFQSRSEQRILCIEMQLATLEDQNAFQFYSEWEKQRPSTVVLVKEYAKQALRPTVAYPYIILVAVLLFQLLS